MLSRREKSEISNTSYIQQDAVFLLMCIQQKIAINGQRGAFSTCCNMFLPEVGNGDDSCMQRQLVAIADL
jgi:hypothetical protein